MWSVRLALGRLHSFTGTAILIFDKQFRKRFQLNEQ